MLAEVTMAIHDVQQSRPQSGAAATEIEDLLRAWDGEAIVVRHDKPTGAWMVVAIHSTRLGPAGGGTRVKPYPSLAAAVQDAMRLSAAMTNKFAVPDLPRGGGKAVIAIPPDLDPQARPDLLRRYGALVHKLGGLFYTASDVGTSAADMDIIAETGAPYIFGRTPAAGGMGDSGPITAWGVFAGLQVVCERLFGDPSPKGRRVLVQGAGQVGGTLIKHLREAGAEVLFNDVAEPAIRHFRDELGLTFVPADAVYTTECDILSPCALGGVLTATTIPQLRCKAVAGGANNQLGEPDDAERLRARGILYAPDYVINAGGAIGILGVETLAWSYARAEQEVAASVAGALRRIFDIAAAEGISTDAAAQRLADERLRAVG
jgi:leucine dehydrogenase